MSGTPIRFNNAEAYERFMGRWSRLVGATFLDWIAPPRGLRWIDVGCGNGAFTELLLDRAAAAHVDGIDPSEGQLTFARSRLRGRQAELHLGSATTLPFADATFDAATMALAIFFVPEPEQGVAEMVRVCRPGSTVAAYGWDMPGGGFPTEPLQRHLRGFGIELPRPPRDDVSTLPALRGLWEGAGLHDIVTRTIEVEREFEDFDDWWASCRGGFTLMALLERLTTADSARLQDLLRQELKPNADGRVRSRARANAIAGVTPHRG